MKTKEYRTQDKSKWLRGPWDDEPDKIQFTDAATGMAHCSDGMKVRWTVELKRKGIDV